MPSAFTFSDQDTQARVITAPRRFVALAALIAALAAVVTVLAAPAGARSAAAPPGLGQVMSGRVASGLSFSCAVLDGGTVQCWGANGNGQLGIGTTNPVGDDELPSATVPLGPGRRATAVTVGALHACALLDDGTIRCWGDNLYGQLGLGHADDVGDDEPADSEPTVRLRQRAVAVAAGSSHTCALLEDGSVRCWGINTGGQLGIGRTDSVGDDEPVLRGTPVQLPGRVVAIASGGNHTCAIRDVGTLHCWGYNRYGQLGIGSDVNLGDNEQVTGSGIDLGPGRTAVAVTAGDIHTCALLDDGALRCWGYGTSGQLGTGSISRIGDDELPTAIAPVQLGAGRSVVGVTASGHITCALLDDDTVRCFGENTYGQLGLGSRSNVGDDELPTAVPPIAFPGRRVVTVSAGWFSACAVLDDGAVHCWGNGEEGRLGTGSVANVGDDELGTAGPDVGITGRVGQFPTAPTTATATAGTRSATVSFTTPAFEGAAPVTGYTVTASPGGATATGTTSPIAVTGLNPGTTYTFTVRAANTFGTGDPSAPSNAVTPTPTPTPTPSEPGAPSGYWMVDAAGHVYPFGTAAHHGDPAGTLPDGVTAVDLEAAPDGAGYWIVDSRGVVHAYGTVAHHGNANPAVLTAGETVTSISRTPAGTGYWLFTTRGRVLSFGDATHYGDVSTLSLNGPVLDSIPTPSGHGYYMVASDGGIFAFGDAEFRGSMGGTRLNAPVQSLVPDHDGTGYWLVASDGGIFAFDADFRGSLGDVALNQPITGMIRYGDGYLMVASDGGIFTFATAPFLGSLGDNPPPHPITNVAAR
jgi:alpha-tubulin suppressor-like RCC1 family protein